MNTSAFSQVSFAPANAFNTSIKKSGIKPLGLRKTITQKQPILFPTTCMAIACGGNGMRLRYVSRMVRKQVMEIGGKTIPERLAFDGLPYFPEIYFATALQHCDPMLQSLQNFPSERRRVIVEENQNGTGPAMAHVLKEAQLQGYEYMVVFYADSYLIRTNEVFDAIARAHEYFGDLPPQTFDLIFSFEKESEELDPSKGWLQLGEALGPQDVFSVTEFLEKPSLEVLKQRDNLVINPAIHLIKIDRALAILEKNHKSKLLEGEKFGWEDTVLKQSPEGIAVCVLRLDEKIWSDLGDVKSWCRTLGSEQGQGNWTTSITDQVIGANCYVLNDGDSFWHFRVEASDLTVILSRREDNSWVLSIFNSEDPPHEDIRKHKIGDPILRGGALLEQDVECFRFLITTNVFVQVDPDTQTIFVARRG